jgi:hypothetical protein
MMSTMTMILDRGRMAARQRMNLRG